MVPTFLTVEVVQAAQDGQVARISKWLNEGGPVDARDVFQCTLLHIAAAAGQTAVVRELVRRGADLDVGPVHLDQVTQGLAKPAEHMSLTTGTYI